MTKTKNFIKDNPLYLFIVGILLFYFSTEIWLHLDNDFYHIWVSGKQTVENRGVLYENPTFILDGYKTINQQWLYSVILYLCHSALGLTGVQLFVSVQFAVLCFIVYKFLMLYKVDKRTAILIVAVSMFMMRYLNCRPQIISIILIYAQLYVLEKHRQTGKTAILYLLPLFTLAQINVHSTFWIFHFVFILPYIVPFNKIIKAIFKKNTLIEDSTINIKPLIIPMLLMAASLFINPYGIDAVLCLFLASDLSYLDVGEMYPFALLSVYAVDVALGAVAAVFLYKKSKLTSTTLYTFIGTGLLYAMAVRNVIFFSIAVTFLLAELVKGADLDRFYSFIQCNGDEAEKRNVRRKMIALLCCELLVCAFFFTTGILTTRKEVDAGIDEVRTPVQAIDYLQANEENLADLKLFADVCSGSYFLYNGVGRVYMETKTEPSIGAINGKKDIINEFVFVQKYATQSDIEAILAEYDFDYLYIRYDLNALQLYLEMSEDYECVVTGDTQTLANGGYEVATYRLYKKVEKSNA